MNYYNQHVFFCINEKDNGKKCCGPQNAKEMCAYAKAQLLDLQIATGKGFVRVSSSGCLGRCSLGPCIVIYPQGVWYTYSSKEDIENIIKTHFLDGKIATSYVIKDAKDEQNSTKVD